MLLYHRCFFVVLCCLALLLSCTSNQQQPEQLLFKQYCGSCHQPPNIDALPKSIWEHHVLPNMRDRMQLAEMPGVPYNQANTAKPIIGLQQWLQLKAYILREAPDSLPQINLPKATKLTKFTQHPMAVDSSSGAFYTFLGHQKNKAVLGDLEGNVLSVDLKKGTTQNLYKGNTAISWYQEKDALRLITAIGILDPSEQKAGEISIIQNNTTTSLKNLHRPVHTLAEDLNNDGRLELVVSEFGHHSGQLSLFKQNSTKQYTKTTLLNLAGSIRTLAKDMDKDGKKDLIVLSAQNQEGISILYQKEDLQFVAERVVSFPAVYGSSWFDLVDYNQDGHLDLIIVNGDNADKSYVHKPYHGMRIYLNDGHNNFTATFFYPLYGATRMVAADFDQDGDIDFGLLSTFPDYENAADRSFVFLENKNTEEFIFETKLLQHPNAGRWFLMDIMDTDQDGDLDIVLSAFTYVFTPVPEALSKQWANTNIDLLLLENTLN